MEKTLAKKLDPGAVPPEVEAEFKQWLDGYENALVDALAGEGEGVAPSPQGKTTATTTPKKVNYRKLAFAHYEQLGQIACAHCGFGIRDVLEIAHLDCNRSNNDIENLAILCPNCHKMHDLNMISTETIRAMRAQPKVAVWSKRMKDAGRKAADTRASTAVKKKRQEAARKAVETRRRNAR